MRRVLFAIVAPLLIWATFPAAATELPRGLGHDSKTHKWVGENCCEQQHCEVIPYEAITPLHDGGYAVAYFSGQGFAVRGSIKSEYVRPSHDAHGRPVGCGFAPSGDGGPYLGYVPGNLICLFYNPQM